MLLNEQQRQIGKDNFSDALRLTRREMLSGAGGDPFGHRVLLGLRAG